MADLKVDTAQIKRHPVSPEHFGEGVTLPEPILAEIRKIGASGGETGDLDTQAEYNAAMKLLRKTAKTSPASVQAYNALFKIGIIAESNSEQFNILPSKGDLGLEVVTMTAKRPSVFIDKDTRECASSIPGTIQQIIAAPTGDIFVLFSSGYVGRVVDVKLGEVFSRRIQHISPAKYGIAHSEAANGELRGTTDGQVELVINNESGEKTLLLDELETNYSLKFCPSP